MKDRERIGMRIHKLDSLLDRNIRSCVRAEGEEEVTVMQGRVIRYLYEHRDRDIFQRDLEEHFSIGRSTVTSILQLMEKNGIIKRESVDYDARLKKVVLTEKAIEKKLCIHSRMEQLDLELVQGISEEDLKRFYYVMDKIEANIKNKLGKEAEDA